MTTKPTDTADAGREWKERLRELKCVNGAMYFGSVEDDSCNCKTRCQNEQTYEHALEELDAFIETELRALKERCRSAVPEASWEQAVFAEDGALTAHAHGWNDCRDATLQAIDNVEI